MSSNRKLSMSLGNMCYCYNRKCNEQYQKEHHLNYRATHISEIWFGKPQPIPKCPYCKKKMTVTANAEDKDQ